jgi:two-component system response regulator NreC
MPTKILLVDGHEIFRDGLRTLINKQTGMQVIGEADDCQGAVELAGRLMPDVVLLDVCTQEISGAETTRLILSAVPGAKVVAISIHRESRHVAEMLEAGASGYLLKDCTADELARAIRIVVQNHTYLTPKIANMVVKNYIQKMTGNNHGVPSVLTAREREILKFLAEGRTAKQTAEQLHLSVKTVETHRRNISQKLNIRTIAELTKYAIREGLISAES